MLNTGTHVIAGPAGAIEMLVDSPKQRPSKGVVIIAHPQPLLGGSAQHKVPHFLAKGMAEAGWLAVRPNFRGVGASQGAHDGGTGETDDLVAVAQQMHALHPDLRLVLAGFSFGAYVQAKVAVALAAAGRAVDRICLAGMPYGVVDSGRVYDTPQGLARALVIHGECDTSVPLQSILDWARPNKQAVVVLPGVDHFFTGHLPALRTLMLDFMA